MRTLLAFLINLIFSHSFLCEIFSDKSYGNKAPDSGELCGSKICLLDASRLLESAAENQTVKPCDDFKEFSMGKFIKYRGLNDRYDGSGFLFDILVSYREKHKKLLQTPIYEHERRIYKIAKNFFQKCIDPKYIRHEGKYEIAEYLKDKNLPMIDGSDWWPNSVNLTRHIFDPSWRLEFFTTFKITRCLSPENSEVEIICFKFSHEFDFLHKIMVKNAEKTRLDFQNRLKEVDFMLGVDQNLINASIDHLFYFLEQKLALNSHEREAVSATLKIKDINDVLVSSTELKIDWFQYINTEFLEHSKAISDDEEVLFEDWELFGKSIELLGHIPIRILMDVFHLGFLYGFEHLYTLYPISRSDVYKRGTQKDFQRHEQCLHILESNYSPVLLSLYAKYNVNKEDLEEAESFVKKAIKDVIFELLKDNELEVEVMDDISRKLNKIVVVTGIYKEILDDSKIDSMYQELELNGDEGLLETTLKLKKYHEKLDNEFKSTWYSQANHLSQLGHMKYFPQKDLLFIPIDYLQYPYYDKNRSRFYNTATLFTEAVLSINEGVKSYLKSEYDLSYSFNYDSIQLGYKNYLNWEQNSGIKEKKLPGFTLNNRQMYWLSFANSYFLKYHLNVPFYQLEALKLQHKHFHVWFKAREEFRDAFECGEMTNEELKDFEELKNNFNIIFRH